MKAYINNIDWADEGDVFFYSIIKEQDLKDLRKLVELCKEFDLFPMEMYWGSNEYLVFNKKDIFNFIDGAVDISKEELKTFRKFDVSGFDIYERIADKIECLFYDDECDFTEQELDTVKDSYINFFGLKNWEEMIEFRSKIENEEYL